MGAGTRAANQTVSRFRLSCESAASNGSPLPGLHSLPPPDVSPRPPFSLRRGFCSLGVAVFTRELLQTSMPSRTRGVPDGNLSRVRLFGHISGIDLKKKKKKGWKVLNSQAGKDIKQINATQHSHIFSTPQIGMHSIHRFRQTWQGEVHSRSGPIDSDKCDHTADQVLLVNVRAIFKVAVRA